MPRSSCDYCCNPGELARKIETYRQAHLGILCDMLEQLQVSNTNVLLGKLTAGNFNITTDQPISINSSSYIVRRIVASNASISLTTAVGGIYTAASKTTPLVANTQVYSALTAPTKFLDLTLTALAGTDVITANTLYLSLTTAQGAAATGDIYIIGDRLD